jgi:hypothetical protein
MTITIFVHNKLTCDKKNINGLDLMIFENINNKLKMKKLIHIIYLHRRSAEVEVQKPIFLFTFNLLLCFFLQPAPLIYYYKHFKKNSNNSNTIDRVQEFFSFQFISIGTLFITIWEKLIEIKIAFVERMN